MATANYEVWWPDRGHNRGDARIVLAVDHRHAATLWADWYDAYSTDYAIVGGEVAEVQVLRVGEKQPTTVKVRGFLTRAYSSDAVDAVGPVRWASMQRVQLNVGYETIDRSLIHPIFSPVPFRRKDG